MQAIFDKITEYKQIAASKGFVFPFVAVRFDLKGTCSGRAMKRNGQYIVRFNPTIARENLDEFLVRTVPHELAHILQFEYRPRVQPHGKEWQDFCRILIGKTIPRCHNYEVSHLKRKIERKKYLYFCNCGQIHLSSVRHNKIQRGVKYNCTRCYSVIKPVYA